MNKILFYLLVLTVLFSCKRSLKDADMIGPEVIAVPENFQVLSFSYQSDSIDYTSSSQYFNAVFSDRVSWKIKILGLESQAIKNLSGTSLVLDITNTVLNGESDNLYLFKKNEKVLAELSFYGTTFILRDTFVIKQPKNYAGVLISDFEGNGLVTGWATYWTPGKFIDKGEKSILAVPQGNFYYNLTGIDFDGGTGVGGMNHSPLVPGFGLTGDPSNLYINVYISGVPNTRVDIRMFESDGDEYTSQQLITWNGWKLLSLPYSTFLLTSTNQVQGQNSEKINEINFLLKSSPPGNQVEVNIDYIICTYDKPFEP